MPEMGLKFDAWINFYCSNAGPFSLFFSAGVWDSDALPGLLWDSRGSCLVASMVVRVTPPTRTMERMTKWQVKDHRGKGGHSCYRELHPKVASQIEKKINHPSTLIIFFLFHIFLPLSPNHKNLFSRVTYADNSVWTQTSLDDVLMSRLGQINS